MPKRRQRNGRGVGISFAIILGITTEILILIQTHKLDMQFILPFRESLPNIRLRDGMPTIYSDWDENTTMYDKARRLFNKRFDLKPAAILMCKTTEHVVKAVALAKEFHLPLRVRSGGHDHEGESSATGCILINFSEMKDVQFEQNNSIVRIGPGWIFKDIVKELDARKVSIPHGTCGTVGVPGFTFGGGWGPWTRLHGMCCDHLIGATVVLGDGSVVNLTKGDADPAKKELLWALRGGGGFSYGIVTELVIKTFEQPHHTRKFRVVFNESSALKVLEKWEDLIDYNQNEALLGTNLQIMGIPLDHSIEVQNSVHPCTFYGYLAGNSETTKRTVKDWFVDFKNYKLIIEQVFDKGTFDINGQVVTITAEDKKFVVQNEIYVFEYGKLVSEEIQLTLNDDDYTFGNWHRITQETHTQEKSEVALQSSFGSKKMLELIPPDADESAPHRLTSRMVQESGLGEEGRKMLINSLRSDLITKQSQAAGIFNYVTLGSISGSFYKPYKDNPKQQYESAFPYHLRPYIIQYQVWWNTEEVYRKAGIEHHVSQLSNRAMDWIDISRERHFPQTKGSFISFKDASVPTQNYFLQNYQRLVDAKKKYSQDENNLFRSRKTII